MKNVTYTSKLFPALSTTILCMISLLLLTNCGRNKQNQQQVEVVVTTAPAFNGDIVASEQIVGQCVAYDAVDLVARVSGFLEKWNFTEGQMVKKDQLLFLIEQDQYKAEVESAEANLKKAQAELQKAMIDYNRFKLLVSKNAAPQKNLDQATCEKLTAEAQVLAAKAALSNAKLNLSYTEVKAPFAGQIGLATYSVGNLVGPSSKKLASLVKLDPMRVQFNISETIILKSILERLKRKLASPKNLIIKLQFENGDIYNREGKIRFWSNQINTSTGTLLIEAVFDNPDQILIPGQYVKVILERRKKENTLLIPRCAVQENQFGHYVLTVNKANKVVSSKIVTGPKSGPLIAVKSGLKDGDLVIIDGLQKVSPKTLVKPVIDKSFMTNHSSSAKKAGSTVPEPQAKPESAPAPSKATKGGAAK